MSAQVRVRLGTLDLDVAFEVPAGTVTAVLGPNGAGKTTLLRAVAGFVPIDAGRVVVAGRVLDAPPGLLVPPERRRLGIVHQDYLLFPHLSALENVAFGPRSRGVPARRARADAGRWLARLGLADHARSRPGRLSGGQQQRIALARALASDPVALLLDEPLAALDASTRPQVRTELRTHLTSFPGATLLVTHDPADVVALADHVVVLDAGRVVDQEPTEQARTSSETT
ncbi:MAG: ABC transporter ATP-binding protein [Actinomycetales bacterium]